MRDQSGILVGMVQTRMFRSEKAKWQALQLKDAEADGQFVYGVSTTGVYCRPNCAARLARRDHVVFFRSCMEAEQAGFRACKRCRPNSESYRERELRTVQRACEVMAEADRSVPLAELSAVVGLSPFHFQRVFKKIVGLTPRQYAMALRDERARVALKRGSSVTEAVYAAGYSASSRFYERSLRALGMKPRQFLAGGTGLKIRYTMVKSTLGLVLVAATDRGICSVHFGESRGELEKYVRKNFARAEIVNGDSAFEQWVTDAVKHIDGSNQASKLPLDFKGTAFQHQVWKALQEIPRGTTSTYTKLAEKIGRPLAVRAVARACATNPVAVLVPCHRVVRSDGELAGYRWGLKRKQQLLRREKHGREGN